MAAESGRKRARKLITLPHGAQIYIPVITEISFVDPFERYQETISTIDNTSESSRKVHVDEVHPTDPVDANGAPLEDAELDTEQTLLVERIDTWITFDALDRGQEKQFSLDNVTGADAAPPHFETHFKTHIYRYFQDPAIPDDSGQWIDSELIDEFQVVDPYDRGQQTNWALDNPYNGDASGQANPDDPDITGGDGIDPPYRTDPFQNIVNWSEESPTGAPGYLYGIASYQIGVESGGPGAPGHVFVFFESPGYTSYPYSFGICTLNLVDSIAVDRGPIWWAYGTWGGLGAVDQSTDAPPAGYSVIFGPSTDGGQAKINMLYSYQNQSPPGDIIPGGTIIIDFSGMSFACSGWVVTPETNPIPDPGSPTTLFQPTIAGHTLSIITSATTILEGSAVIGWTMKLGPHIQTPT